MRALAAVLLFALAGCPLDREQYDRTPAGWYVHWEERGTITTGRHSKLQLYELFDAAMERGIEEVHAGWGFDPAYVRRVLRDRDALYTLVDNFWFPIVGQAQDWDGVSTGASGETLNKFETIVAFYNKAGGLSTDPSSVPPDVLSWTVKIGPTTGLYYWGVETDGLQYPALGYELHWQFTLVP